MKTPLCLSALAAQLLWVPAAQADPGYRVFSAIRGDGGETLDFAILYTTKSRWSDGGETQLRRELKTLYPDAYISSRAVAQPECYVFSSRDEPTGRSTFNVNAGHGSLDDAKAAAKRFADSDYKIIEVECVGAPSGSNDWRLKLSSGRYVTNATPAERPTRAEGAGGGSFENFMRDAIEEPVMTARVQRYPCRDGGSATVEDKGRGLVQITHDNGTLLRFHTRQLFRGEAGGAAVSSRLDALVAGVCQPKAGPSIIDRITTFMKSWVRRDYDRCVERGGKPLQCRKEAEFTLTAAIGTRG
ncbi:hypothetical protein [Sphingomicrobium astaxanthinifaciens]|uniref:hypothetical protein n=1 Tax=Sphingomicrobium astaxanthinifaciens TaxID=1227949 RepID=UPI001FCB61DB|nr:hypothetical protein [Sphingomicrobium astaxanthinifaciens]MCJ7420430.1 hypothetical protein [Sphingomicrobium astaxanthinifaciens]